MSITLSLANMLGGVMLFCAFLQIPARQIAVMLLLCRLLAFALAGEAILRAVLAHEWSLYVLAMLILAAQGGGLPWAMQAMGRRCEDGRWGEMIMPLSLALLIGLLPVGLAVMSLLPAAGTAFSSAVWPVACEPLMISFAVVLLGLWLIIVKKQSLARIMGFVVLADGLSLAIETIAGLGGAGLIAIIALLGLASMLVGLAERGQVMAPSGTDGAEL